LGRSPRELSHFSDNAGCGLSVSTRFPLRGSRPIPTACRPCRSAGFWPTECDPPLAFTLPGYSPRSAVRVPYPFVILPLAGQDQFRGRSGTTGSAIRPCRPAAALRLSAVATRTVKRLPPTMGLPPPARLGNTQAAYCRSRSRPPLAVAVRMVTRRRGLSDRPRLALPSQTYLPCGQAALGSGRDYLSATPLPAITVGMYRQPSRAGSHLPPMTPGLDRLEGEPPERPPRCGAAWACLVRPPLQEAGVLGMRSAL